MSMEDDKSWAVSRKSISLPNFCVDNSGICFKLDNNEDDSYTETSSPQIVITPPPIDRKFGYVPCLEPVCKHSRFLRHDRRLLDASKMKFLKPDQRWSSRLFKRRNAVSSYDLNFLHKTGQSMLEMVENMDCRVKIKLKKPSKLTKRVICDEDEFFTNANSIKSNQPDNKNTADALSLVNNFQNYCQISPLHIPIVSTEALCTQFSAMPIDETTTLNTTPVASTSFSCKTPFNLSCLNL